VERITQPLIDCTTKLTQIPLIDSYDFGSSAITSRIGGHAKVFSQHRTQPPPPEVYTLHRKLAGAFLLCTKLKCDFECRELLDEVWERVRKGDVEV
jgi:aarF domain-containing kinase